MAVCGVKTPYSLIGNLHRSLQHKRLYLEIKAHFSLKDFAKPAGLLTPEVKLSLI